MHEIADGFEIAVAAAVNDEGFVPTAEKVAEEAVAAIESGSVAAVPGG
jgi:hypothetical protein